jgi:predicted AAA+ superfamily ATPase
MLLKAYGDPASGLGLPHDGLFYWAPAQGGTEVDFVVRHGREVVAIEVKAKRRLASRDFRGLRAIAGLAGLKRRIVVFLGERPFVTDEGIEALPVAEFVEELQERRI